MVYFRAVHKHNHYYVTCRDLCEKNNLTQFIFDTGAERTVISIEMICRGMSETVKRQFIDTLGSSKYSEKFSSVAKKSDIVGIPYKFNDVKIGNMRLQQLLCYVIFKSNKSIALLGDDFVSCCKYNHNYSEDIIVDGFDFDTYNKSIDNIDCINIPRDLCLLLGWGDFVNCDERINLSESLAPTDRVSQMEAEMKKVIDKSNKQL